MQSLKDFIAIYDGVLDAGLCRRLIENFERFSELQVRNGAGVREGLEQSAWTEMDITKHADLELKSHFQDIVLRYFATYNKSVGLSLPITPLHKLSELRMKRYRLAQGDQFQIHFDSIRALSNRYLVFLWYLNDVQEGGETDFPDLGVRIPAKAGRLVVFPPYWMFQHAGLSPKQGDKYIVSTYALY